VFVFLFCYRLLQCSCHLGLLGRAMDIDQKDTDQLEAQFASMSLNSATGSGGVSRCVRCVATVAKWEGCNSTQAINRTWSLLY